MCRFFFLFVAFVAAFLGACSSGGFKIPSPKLFAKVSNGMTVTQEGAAAIPARVSTNKTQTTIPLNPGVSITISTAGVKDERATSSQIGPPPPVVISTETESITGPTAFEPAPPPLPPSAVELAKASGVKMFYFIAGALLLAAAFFAYTGHGKAALMAGGGAVAVPLLANFLSSEWAMRAALIFSAVAGALYLAYYLMRHKYALGTVTTQKEPNEIPT